MIAGEFILSTSGIGHEIAFAYDNFDNAMMYGLILFVLCVATAFNMWSSPRSERLLRTAARRMTAVRDPCAGPCCSLALLVAWQLLHQLAGDTALTAPLRRRSRISGR